MDKNDGYTIEIRHHAGIETDVITVDMERFSTVRVNLPNGQYIDIDPRPDGLNIVAERSLVARPRVSNIVTVMSEDH